MTRFPRKLLNVIVVPSSAFNVKSGAITASSAGVIDGQAQLDELLQYIYTYRAQWTASAPLLHIGGSNPAASGTYADQDPPTTGKAYIYELVNDPEAEGFSLWAITYTA